VSVASEERIERLEVIGRHTVSGARRLPSQDDRRTRHAQAWTSNKRKKRLGRTLVLVNKRGRGRYYGEAAEDGRSTGTETGVYFDIGGGGECGYDDRLRLGRFGCYRMRAVI
jgi:hypothetical protein